MLLLQGIDRAADAVCAAVQDMGVDHRGLHVFMTQQLPDRTDLAARLRQVIDFPQARARAGLQRSIPNSGD